MSELDIDANNSLDEATVVRLRNVLNTALEKVCPPWLAHSRDDLVQIACLKVMDILKDPNKQTPLKTAYLWRVAHTTVIDEIRRQGRKRETSLDSTEEAPFNQQVSTGEYSLTSKLDPERLFQGRQLGQSLRGCLANLVRTRRLALTLHLQGHTVPQVARHLEWSLKRAENMVYRGLEQLRQCLSKKGWQP